MSLSEDSFVISSKSLEIGSVVERIKNLDIKISEARSQMEEFQKSYFATIFYGL